MPLSPREQEKLGLLIERIEPFWRDLLHQGSIQQKFGRSPTPTFVLAFRQNRTGPRDGRQKRVYIGKSQSVAWALMEEIWQRREKAGTHRRPQPMQPRGADRSLSDYVKQKLQQDPAWGAGREGMSLLALLGQQPNPCPCEVPFRGSQAVSPGTSVLRHGVTRGTRETPASQTNEGRCSV